MKYIQVLFLIIISVYPLSYAKYNWKSNNKFGAIGVVLIVLASVVITSALFFIPYNWLR